MNVERAYTSKNRRSFYRDVITCKTMSGTLALYYDYV
ncbi:hypothetical protein F383_14778 [Gossypium arboreum]|uniref:Uncharacterized protein n=1 Tax=Gossypium arboreum TaxID=29729 RepID=A0A0B0NGJ7_GOSAR|nr:hypothetical protein F383_14778 [Gossypium arboreum]